MDFIVKQALGGATKDLNKMMDKEETDPKQAEAQKEYLEVMAEEEAERSAKFEKVEAVRRVERQAIRDKYGIKSKVEKEAEAQAQAEVETAGRLTREKKIPGQESVDTEEEQTLLGQAEKTFADIQQKVTAAKEDCIIS